MTWTERTRWRDATAATAWTSKQPAFSPQIAPLVGIAAVAAVLGALSLLAPRPVSLIFMSAISVIAPLGVALVLALIRGLPLTGATPANVVALAHTTFFGAGFVEYLQNGQRVAFGVYGVIPLDAAAFVLLAVACVSIPLVLGLSLWAPSPTTSLPTDGVPQALWLTLHLLFALVSVGFVQTVAAGGGIANVAATLQMHDKQANQLVAGIGASVWSLFATPTLMIAGYVALAKSASAHHRVVAAIEFLLLTVAAIGVYGSRLTVVVAAVGVVAARYLATRKPVRFHILVLGVAAILAVSFLVLEARAEAQQNTTATTNSLDILSYSIFDVSLAASLNRAEIAPLLSSPDRVITLLGAALPRFGDGSEGLASSGIDVIMAQQLGNPAQAATSGLPPSLPTFLWLAYGVFAGSVIAICLGAIASGGLWVLTRSQGAFTNLAYGLFIAFVFNSFKGGDIFLDISSEVRRWAYLAIVVAGTLVIDRWLRRRSQRRHEVPAVQEIQT